jgi:23S rRNA pseudouridine2605 synthase
VRLNRFLSQCGLGSRRSSELLVLEGRVAINGKLIKDLATNVGDEDQVTVDGKPARPETGIVIALNKPRGYICSRSDEKDRMTIYALLPKPLQTLHHVGRLDKDSEGLLLLTNRGDLSHHLIHPSKGAEKEYEVIVDKPLDQAVMARLVKGMITEEGYAKSERAWMDSEYRCHVVLKQGLKRQIRLMFYQLGFEVVRLVRVRIGWLELKGLQRGGWKQLSSTEVERFFSKEGTTGRPPRLDKPKVAATDSDEHDEVIRPAKTIERPAREERSFGKKRATGKFRTSREEVPEPEVRPEVRGRSTGRKERTSKGRAPRDGRPFGKSKDRPATTDRPARAGITFSRDRRADSKATPSRDRPEGRTRPAREDRSEESAGPPRRGRNFEKSRSSSRDSSPSRPGPRSSSARAEGKRPASKRSSGPRRRA